MEKVTLDTIIYVSMGIINIPSKPKCISDSDFMIYG